MNKAVTPKQLELTAGKTREELLIQMLPRHIDPDSPAFKADVEKIHAGEKVEAARAVLGTGSEEEFDWDSPTEDSIILREQRATAAYRNRHGELIIRQRATWDAETDTFVFISPENEVTFMEGLAKRARE
ncbi:hypothetical protein AB8Z38_06805 [Bradyrhizobium sp. LLZ17]|uniref:Uncharacterized protein n=1 Tax=Bradyrhizobium sp. LLZ17 TaxID=3239388 RepID=A0AB39XN17_9BRAD